MYTYRHDAETGGLVLLDDDTILHSNEPRPVYAQEMLFLGMDQHWQFENQMDTPYLWAESSTYWYKDKIIAKVSGGSLYEVPKLLPYVDKETGARTVPDGTTLEPVDLDAMVQKNEALLTTLEQHTIMRIYRYYRKHQDLDCFYVAFSGGKDSITLLELVKRALPKKSFIVVFGDTGMEFPDTYTLVDQVEAQCNAEGIPFYRASSKYDPMESWRLFGPPSRTLRWCCSVHKSAPQTLKIREVMGKEDVVSASFVGVRRDESTKRSTYDFENYGKKTSGQYTMHPILDWNSAEVWLYIFRNHLPINKAYKKGNSRAGCLLCPMGGGKGDALRNLCYPDAIQNYINAIQEVNDVPNIAKYIQNDGWKVRKTNQFLAIRSYTFTQENKQGYLYITVQNPGTPWTEWIKTLGDDIFPYTVEDIPDGYVVKVSLEYERHPMMKYFKQVFHKSAACVACETCTANCHYGCIHFEQGLKIENCHHCLSCFQIEEGCLRFDSLYTSAYKGDFMKKQSINSLNAHAPKLEWINEYFKNGNQFFYQSMLGPNQMEYFKRFLLDSSLAEKEKSTYQTTHFFDIIQTIGDTSATAWGLIYLNLINKMPQINWYVQNMPIGTTFTYAEFKNLIMSFDVKDQSAGQILVAFGRLCDLPLGTALHFGEVTRKGKSIETLTRTKATVEDGRVILYALYQYAEANDGIYQFSVSHLKDKDAEGNGISPVQIFGTTDTELEQFLNGLSANYPDFINASFTLGLDKVTLNAEKSAEDVLDLFT